MLTGNGYYDDLQYENIEIQNNSKQTFQNEELSNY